MLCDAAEQLFGYLGVNKWLNSDILVVLLALMRSSMLLLIRKFSNGVILSKSCCYSVTGCLHCSFKITAVRVDNSVVCSA